MKIIKLSFKSFYNLQTNNFPILNNLLKISFERQFSDLNDYYI